MADATVILRNREDREVATRWVSALPDGSTVAFTKPKRSLPQNALLHHKLGIIATKTTHYGLRLSIDDWRRVFSAALKHELRTAPTLDGTGMVILPPRTSKMSKEELSDLLALVDAWAAQNGVDLEAGYGNPKGLEVASGDAGEDGG